jgi:aspartate ammonia-lyase
MRLDQAFGSYASLPRRTASALHAQLPAMRTICIGATTVGAGLGTYRGYRGAVTARLSELIGTPLAHASDLCEAVRNMDEFATLAATIKTLALSLAKITNDIVLLGSGPHGGIAELTLEPQQTGTSRVPGKVNPVHAIGLTQIAFAVAGAARAVALVKRSAWCNAWSHYSMNVSCARLPLSGRRASAICSNRRPSRPS